MRKARSQIVKAHIKIGSDLIRPASLWHAHQLFKLHQHLRGASVIFEIAMDQCEKPMRHQLVRRALERLAAKLKSLYKIAALHRNFGKKIERGSTIARGKAWILKSMLKLVFPCLVLLNYYKRIADLKLRVCVRRIIAKLIPQQLDVAERFLSQYVKALRVAEMNYRH
jgi:hypothetical protein